MRIKSKRQNYCKQDFFNGIRKRFAAAIYRAALDAGVMDDVVFN